MTMQALFDHPGDLRSSCSLAIVRVLLLARSPSPPSPRNRANCFQTGEEDWEKRKPGGIYGRERR